MQLLIAILLLLVLSAWVFYSFNVSTLSIINQRIHTNHTSNSTFNISATDLLIQKLKNPRYRASVNIVDLQNPTHADTIHHPAAFLPWGPTDGSHPPGARVLHVGLCPGGGGYTVIAMHLLIHMIAYVLDDYNVYIYNLSSSGNRPPGSKAPEVDMLMCLGHFYNRSFSELRNELPSRKPEKEDERNDTFWEHKSVVRDFSHRNKTTPKAKFLVAFSGEAWDHGDCSRFDVMFTCVDTRRFNHCPTIFWPSGPRSVFRRPKHAVEDFLVTKDLDVNDIAGRKFFFAALLVKQCFTTKYGDYTHLLRSVFFHLLSEYKPVFGLGACKPKGHHQAVITNATYIMRAGADLEGPSHIFQNFKFAITFENRISGGYYTEKALNALAAHTIPIYLGDPEAKLVANTESMIIANVDSEKLEKWRVITKEDVQIINTGVEPMNALAERKIQEGIELFRSDFQPAVDEVIQLDSNVWLYKAKLKHSVVPNNKIEGTAFDLVKQGRALRGIMEVQKLVEPYDFKCSHRTKMLEFREREQREREQREQEQREQPASSPP